MSEIKNRDRILEAIDQLRRRKARPDAERICNFVMRRFGVDSQDTIADLERLVEEDIVIKVEYKGNISYRNAAKWSRYAMYNKNKEEGFTGTIYGSLNSEGTSSLLSTAIAELIIHEPDYLDFGVPGHELEKYMQEKDSVRFTKRYLEVILQRELNSGNIVKLENGNYSLADHPVPSSPNLNNNHSNNSETVKMLKIDSPSEQVSEEEQNISRNQINGNTNAMPPKATDVNKKTDDSSIYDAKKASLEATVHASASTEGFRDGAKRKRSKKVFFDPSDIHVPTRKRGRPLGSTKNKDKEAAKSNNSSLKVEVDRGSCYICMNQGQDRRGQFEKLISCKDCTNKVHPSCIDNGKDVSHSSLWQCVQCKTCVVCIETIEKGPMAVCCGCSESYHLSCHDPKISEGIRSSEFVCSRCMPPPMKAGFDIDDQLLPKDSREIPVQNIGEPSDAQIDDRIPDVSDWSVEQVSKYLEDQGYPVQAAVFRDHDIDGASLLLMKRSDVLIGLHLKLGPALKIYGQVKKLQIRQSDPTYLWP
ncbi:PHD finger protein 10 isoform X2 [Periplaneta americana]|uniref:PHD finger protein 10 isoform X2 n=1 Tax=Periplaneta americana TaxID=6978 RepID=UPI0037E8C17E